MYLWHHVCLFFTAYNPKSSEYIRKKYKKKLAEYENTCDLISYLGNTMTRRYKEPKDRPQEFDFKLETFIQLKNKEPTTTYCWTYCWTFHLWATGDAHSIHLLHFIHKYELFFIIDNSALWLLFRCDFMPSKPMYFLVLSLQPFWGLSTVWCT